MSYAWSHLESAARAANDMGHKALVLQARHLRWDHGFGRRRTARAVGMTEKWVTTYVDEVKGKL